MKFRFGCLLCGLAAASVVYADSSGDALHWLHRVAISAQEVSYSGTFVYQSGTRAESSRITHIAEDDSDMEHIEMLDGSPREVVRIGDEVKTWLPESRRLIIERRVARPGFPAVLPTGLAELTDYYILRRDAQPISIEPRDTSRYRRQLWIDRKTGLLLKSETFNENGQLRESSTFTQLTLGALANRDAIRARFNRQDSNWRVQDVRSEATGSDDGLWELRTIPPGFRQVASVNRQVNPDLPEGSQLVFSDGLASISLFFEPLMANSSTSAQGQFAMGALNVYKRIIGKHLVVLMGDVPSAALKKFGDGVTLRKP